MNVSRTFLLIILEQEVIGEAEDSWNEKAEDHPHVSLSLDNPTKPVQCYSDHDPPQLPYKTIYIDILPASLWGTSLTKTGFVHNARKYQGSLKITSISFA